MRAWFGYYRQCWRDKRLVLSASLSALLLFFALVVNFYAGSYATKSASNAVTDIVLSNIRVFDVDTLFIYSSIIFWIFGGLVILLHPKRLPFSLNSITLFILVRSAFISLTHIGPYPTQLIINSTVLDKFAFGGDLFFSGHTGLPFLLTLVFWDKKSLRSIFLVASLFFGTIVLLGHLHYSIDVLAAFFITHTIYHLAEIIFARDRARFTR